MGHRAAAHRQAGGGRGSATREGTLKKGKGGKAKSGKQKAASRSKAPRRPELLSLSAFLLELCSVDAPNPAAARRNVEEDEAVQHRPLALILNRQERVEAVRHPVGGGHETAAEECY